MTEEKIQMFLMSNQKKFSQAQIATVTERLRQLDDDKWLMITSVDYKDPTLLLVLSILAGGLGIDRFLLGDTGIGILKLLTAGCLGVLTVIDWFTISDKARQKNFETFMAVANMQANTDPQSRQMHGEDHCIEELKKYKQLLDCGVITQEEFDRKKGELLCG